MYTPIWSLVKEMEQTLVEINVIFLEKKHMVWTHCRYVSVPKMTLIYLAVAENKSSTGQTDDGRQRHGNTSAVQY